MLDEPPGAVAEAILGAEAEERDALEGHRLRGHLHHDGLGLGLVLGSLLLGSLLLLLLLIGERLEQNGHEEVHDDEEADDEAGDEERARQEHSVDRGAHLEGVDPAACEDAKDGEHRREEVVEVPTAVLRDACGAKDLHAEQGEDEHHQEHEHEQVGDLRHRLDEAHHNLVQPGPCLEQPQQTEETKHPKEGDVDARVREEDGDKHLADREGHDDAIEQVPAVTPVPFAAESDDLEEHLNDEDPGDEGAQPLGQVLPRLRLARVGHAHDHEVEDDKPRRDVAHRLASHQFLERESAATRGRAVAAARTRLLGAVGHGSPGLNEGGRLLLVHVKRGVALRRTLVDLLFGIIARLRAHELVEDDRAEEVDHEHTPDDGDADEVDPRVVMVGQHDVEHRAGPRVEGDRLDDRDHRRRDVVERDRAAVGVLLEVEAARTSIGGIAHGGIGEAKRT